MTRTILAFDYHRDDELREIVRDGIAYFEVKRRPGRSDAYAASQEKIKADEVGEYILRMGYKRKRGADRSGVTTEGVAWLRQEGARCQRERPRPPTATGRAVLARGSTKDGAYREVVRDGNTFHEFTRKPGAFGGVVESTKPLAPDDVAGRVMWVGDRLFGKGSETTAAGAAWLDYDRVRARCDHLNDPVTATPRPDPDALLARDVRQKTVRATFAPWTKVPEPTAAPASPCVCAGGFAVVTPAACKGKGNDAIGDLVWTAAEKNDGGKVATPAEQPPLEVKRGGKTFVYYDDSEGDFWPEQPIKEGFTVMPVGYGLGRKGSRVTVYYVAHPSAAKMKAVRAHLKKHLPRFF